MTFQRNHTTLPVRAPMAFRIPQHVLQTNGDVLVTGVLENMIEYNLKEAYVQNIHCQGWRV